MAWKSKECCPFLSPRPTHIPLHHGGEKRVSFGLQHREPAGIRENMKLADENV